MASNRLFPRSRCPFPIPTPNAERYRPYQRRGEWTVITGSFRVRGEYGVLRESGTAEHILLHTVGGAGFVVTDTGWERLGSGGSAVIEPHQAHYYGTCPDAGTWQFLWVHFFPPPHWRFLQDIPRGLPGLRLSEVGEDLVRRKIQRALRESHALRQRGGQASEALAINALERAFLWIVDSTDVRRRPDRRILRAMEAVIAAPEAATSVADLARVAGLSPSRFAHVFLEQTGETPQRFVERVRLETAAEWIRAGGQTISEIAEALGFSSAFYFSRRFKARFGSSPSRFAGARGSPHGSAGDGAR